MRVIDDGEERSRSRDIGMRRIRGGIVAISFLSPEETFNNAIRPRILRWTSVSAGR